MPSVNEQDRTLYEHHPDLGLLMIDGRTIISAALDASVTLIDDPDPENVRFVPGGSSLVLYRAAVRHRDDPPVVTRFVASIGKRVTDGTAIVTAGDRRIAVWRVPHDPFLPGLPILSDTESTARLLAQLGIDSDITRMRRRSYRPSRRAVVEITTDTHRVFAKVVRTHTTARLQQLHTAIARHAPIPRSLGWSAPTGIAMLEALPGVPLRQSIETPGAPLPSPEELISLLDTLRVGDVGDQVREGLAGGLPRHVRLLCAVLPDHAVHIRETADAIAQDSTDSPIVPVHGDYHSSQVIVTDGTATGLIDVDTAGMGERIDDLANLLAHVTVIADTRPSVRQRAASYGAELTSAFDQLVDPRQLRLRVAAAILGYATGPFRVQEADWRHATLRRVALADQWVESAMGGS